MMAAFVVLALGLGVTALGVIEPDLYFVGLEVLFIASIGILVRLVDLARWLRR